MTVSANTCLKVTPKILRIIIYKCRKCHINLLNKSEFSLFLRFYVFLRFYTIPPLPSIMHSSPICILTFHFDLKTQKVNVIFNKQPSYYQFRLRFRSNLGNYKATGQAENLESWASGTQ